MMVDGNGGKMRVMLVTGNGADSPDSGVQVGPAC